MHVVDQKDFEFNSYYFSFFDVFVMKFCLSSIPEGEGEGEGEDKGDEGKGATEGAQKY